MPLAATNLVAHDMHGVGMEHGSMGAAREVEVPVRALRGWKVSLEGERAKFEISRTHALQLSHACFRGVCGETNVTRLARKGRLLPSLSLC